jgi:hypothetical protein
MKVPKYLFRPALSSIAIVVITAIFPTIESVKSINRAFLKVFILPTIYDAIILSRVDLFHLQTQQADYLFCLINSHKN